MEPRMGGTIRIGIKTVDGDYNMFEMGRDSTTDRAAEVAMEYFGIDPSDDAKYRLAVKTPSREFRTLDMARTLLDEGIADGDTLWLGTEQVVG